MRTGLDRLAESPELAARLRGERVGLLAHAASVTRDLVHGRPRSSTSWVSGRRSSSRRSTASAGKPRTWSASRTARASTGIAVRSLYGEHFADLSPRDDDLANLDCLLIDLQDIGSRYYTFVWTAVLAVRACLKRGVRVVVLDRREPDRRGPADDRGPGAVGRVPLVRRARADPHPARSHAGGDCRVARPRRGRVPGGGRGGPGPRARSRGARERVGQAVRRCRRRTCRRMRRRSSTPGLA